MKLDVITNLSFNSLDTCNLAFSHTHPKGYGFGWGLFLSPNVLTVSLEIRLACELLSKCVSIFTCFEKATIWNNSSYFFS